MKRTFFTMAMICITIFCLHGQNDIKRQVEKQQAENDIKNKIMSIFDSMPTEILGAYHDLKKMGKEDIVWRINTLIESHSLADQATKAATPEAAFAKSRESYNKMAERLTISNVTTKGEAIAKEMERFSKLSLDAKQKNIEALQQDIRNSENSTKNNSKVLFEYLNKLQEKHNDEISGEAINIIKNEMNKIAESASNVLKEKRDELAKKCPNCVKK